MNVIQAGNPYAGSTAAAANLAAAQNHANQLQEAATAAAAQVHAQAAGKVQDGKVYGSI